MSLASKCDARKAAITNATFTPKETAKLVADACGRSVTAKQLRGFIRRMDEAGTPIVAPVGSGARYAFTADEVHALVTAYARRPISAGSPAVRSLEELRTLVYGDDGDDADDATDADDDAEDNGDDA